MNHKLRQVIKYFVAYRFLAVIFMPLLVLLLLCWLFLGGLPSRYNRLYYIGNNFQARLYQLSHSSLSDHKNTYAYASGKVTLPVLLYHGIVPRLDKHQSIDTYQVTQNNFLQQMLALKRAGFNTVTTYDIQDYLTHKKQLPTKPILITFDDAQKNSYYASRVILDSLHYKAVMFTITGDSLDKPGSYYLNKKELVRMNHSGSWDIESHADKGHVYIQVSKSGEKASFYGNKLWLVSANRLETDTEYKTRISKDLQASAKRVQQISGKYPTSIAFPYGDIGEDSNYKHATTNLLQESKKYFANGYIQWWPTRGYNQNLLVNNQFLMKRISVDPKWGAKDILSVLDSGSLIKIPYTYSAKSSSFINFWGDYYTSSNHLIIKSKPDSSGSGIVLDGSQYWYNFKISYVLTAASAKNIMSVVKYRDGQNYIACSYDDNKIQAVSTIQSQQTILSEAALKVPILDNKPHELTISLKDNTISCEAEGTRIMAPIPISPIFSSGDIGFMTYYPILGQSVVYIDRLKVDLL